MVSSIVAPFYTPVASTDTTFYIGKFVHELETGETEAFLTRLSCFFADFPYELNEKRNVIIKLYSISSSNSWGNSRKRKSVPLSVVPTQ